MEPTDNLPLIGQVKEYLETNFMLFKYQAIARANTVVATIGINVLMVLMSLFAFLFFSITLALLAAHYLNSTWQGYACVTLLFVLISLSIRMLKVRFQNILIKVFIEKLFKKK